MVYLPLFPLPFPHVAFMHCVLNQNPALLYAFAIARDQRVPFGERLFVIQMAVCAGFWEPVALTYIVFCEAGTFFLFFKAVFVVGAAACLQVEKVAGDSCEMDFLLFAAPGDEFSEAAQAAAIAKGFPLLVVHLEQRSRFVKISIQYYFASS